MVNVYYYIESLAKSDIVSGATTLREFCDAHGLAATKQITVNGQIETDLNRPLSQFADGNNNVDIVVSTKLANA